MFLFLGRGDFSAWSWSGVLWVSFWRRAFLRRCCGFVFAVECFGVGLGLYVLCCCRGTVFVWCVMWCGVVWCGAVFLLRIILCGVFCFTVCLRAVYIVVLCFGACAQGSPVAVTRWYDGAIDRSLSLGPVLSFHRACCTLSTAPWTHRPSL